MVSAVTKIIRIISTSTWNYLNERQRKKGLKNLVPWGGPPHSSVFKMLCYSLGLSK